MKRFVPMAARNKETMMTNAQRVTCIGMVVMIAGLLWLPAAALAQTVTSGAIAGVVRDTSGAVLPGATVEAASPALIEKVRAVVADASGQYRIVDLRPGVYTVTFSLPGFGTVVREGIELTTGFTATVNAEMKVGALEETITVTGSSPIVDTQNVRTQNVLSHEYLEAVPTGKAASAYASLILGATSSLGPDVGGTKGDASNITVQVHNSRGSDNMVMLDGMRYTYQRSGGGGGARGFYLNHLGVQEVVLETSGQSAESETAGIQQNAVPKDGGNTFQLVAIGNYSSADMGTNSLTDELRARGLTATNAVKQLYDVGLGFGGPLKKDRLWFYTAHRRQVAHEYFAGNYFNKTPNTLFYTPDLSRQAYLDVHSRDNSVRLTWQASEKHKITVYESNQRNCQCFFQIQSNRSPEATNDTDFRPNLLQGTWSYPATNRLLFQVGATYGRTPWVQDPVEGVTKDARSVTELSTGYQYGSYQGSAARPGYTDYKNDQINLRASESYVTGTHAFKAGVFYFLGVPATDDFNYAFQNVAYSLRTPAPGAAPVPVSITLIAVPNRSKTGAQNFGLYAQDQWTLKRLTLNLGVRFDSMHSWVPAFTAPGGEFVPEFSFAKVDNVPNWKDLSPRLGAAYDLFGNGRTAIKASLGRYVVAEGTFIAAASSPATAVVRFASRTWNDANGDYVPQESELGPLSNRAFGTVVQTSRYAKEILEGGWVRPYTWLASAVLQQELRPGLGLTVSYFRSWYGNFTTTDNLRVTPADYSPFCVTAPVDARLPGGGGNQICGQYDINPTAFGAVNNLVTAASHFGKQTEVFNSIEASLSARFGRGGVINGGAYYGNAVTDTCFVVDSPQALYRCKTDNPSTQYKVNGTYPLPWDLQFAWVYQNLQGIPILANLVYTNAQIAPSLGRNLGSCGTRAVCNGTATVSLVEPGTMFEDRYTQLDLRVSKSFRLGRARWQGMVDAYNVFNASGITGRNNTYGSLWGRPTQVQLGRLFKVGTQLDW